MKILNPKISMLLVDLSTLGAFASSAAASAAQPVQAPMAMASTPLTDDLIGAYQADEQADRGALFKGAVAKMEAVVAELKTLDVLVDEPAPVVIEAPPAAPTETAPAPSGSTLPLPPLEPAPAAPPAEPVPQ